MGIRKIIAVAIVVSSMACAPAIKMTPTGPMRTISKDRTIYTLVEQVEGRSTAGYLRQLPANSKWVKFGSFDHGEVFKPLNVTLTVEGTHEREAYIVVKEKRWIGFWLPYEEAFSPTEVPSPIKLQKGEDKL